MKIAIIGFALSGATFLQTILDNDPTDLKIYIYEKRNEYPTGLPYEKDSLDKLLNVDTDEMVYPEDMADDFPKWMDANNKNLDPVENMAPRVYFGQYLKEKTKDYLNNPCVNFINEEVKNISVEIIASNESYTVESATKRAKYDLVFLGTGASFYQDPYKLEGKENYIAKPYPLEEKLKDIKEDKRITILGTSASSTDVFRYLSKNKKLKEPISFFTGPSEYKIVDIPYEGNILDYYSPNQEWIDKELEACGEIKLDRLVNTINDDFKKAGVELSYAYETYKDHTLALSKKAIEINDQELAFTEDYFIQFALYVADLANFMNPIDRKVFLENHYIYLSFLGGKTPYGSMKLLLDYYDKGKMDVTTNLEEVKVNSDGSFTLIGDKKIDADIIINSTGFEMDLQKIAQRIPLYESLLRNEMIMADTNGEGIAVTWPRCNPLSKKFGKLNNLFITGMLITQTDIDNNDARCIQKTSMRIGEIVLDENNF